VSEHILRKELKRDEFRETVIHGAESMMTHQEGLYRLLAAVLVVAILGFGWMYYSNRQTGKAATGFDAGMKIFQANINPAGGSTVPGQVTYMFEDAKYQDALKQFRAVALGYPRTRPGQLAAYYAGLCQEQLKQDDEARKWLEGVAKVHDFEISALARFELGQLYLRVGRGDDAVRIFQALIDKPASLVPKPLVMLTLADYYRQKNPAEATKLYTQVKADYPNTPAATQADEGLGFVGNKS
jgi:tetratricopeptide (TPR) repeat protein